MARKLKPPPEKPSKAYLVSFGDTMTALLAFFIVLNSFSKEQTGANMYSGTGSFMNTSKNIGLPGGSLGDRSRLTAQKKAPSPIYAVANDKENSDSVKRDGPDSDPDDKRIIDRQTENFKRFLANIDKSFSLEETPPTKSQIVLDSFENLNKPKKGEPYRPLGKSAIRIAAEAIMKLGSDDFKLEVIVWSNMPGEKPMLRTMDKAIGVQEQIDAMFTLTPQQRSRLHVSSKPWLFADAIRPRLSFAISRLDLATD
jgi:flagellar motor protein MotB